MKNALHKFNFEKKVKLSYCVYKYSVGIKLHYIFLLAGFQVPVVTTLKLALAAFLKSTQLSPVHLCTDLLIFLEIPFYFMSWLLQLRRIKLALDK